MKSTRQIKVTGKWKRRIGNEVNRQWITLADLVDWAEKSMMESDFDEKEVETIREIVGRLGLADVKAFGLTWEDVQNYLSRLGYRVDLKITETPAVGQ